MLSLIYLKKPKKIIISTTASAIVASIILTVNPLAVERFTDFISEDKGVDVTREYVNFLRQKIFPNQPYDSSNR